MAASYQGPGDIGLTYYVFYSCARAYSASYASGLGNLCEVTRTSDTAKCILKSNPSGFADLTSVNCNGNTQTIVQFCNATTCGIDTAYDQTGNSRDAVQATAATQPSLTFSALNSLPGMTCATGVSCVLATSGTHTIAQPVTMTGVYKRTANPTTLGGIVGSGTGLAGIIGPSSTSGNAQVDAGTEASVSGATESVFHALTGLQNGTGNNCAVNLDGTDTTSLNCGVGPISAVTLRVNRAGGSQMAGVIMEVGVIAATTNATQRGAIYTNDHGANGYNGGV